MSTTVKKTSAQKTSAKNTPSKRQSAATVDPAVKAGSQAAGKAKLSAKVSPATAVKSAKSVGQADVAGRATAKAAAPKSSSAAAKVAGKTAGQAAAQATSASTARQLAVKASAKTARAKPAASNKPVAKRSSSTQVSARQAKADAMAKAKRLAPDLAARIGSTPQTQYRGNPDIFGRLVEDHDRHRALLAMIDETTGKSPERERLFKELVLEIKAHAAAEEQALWSTVMRHPETTDDARHAVGEHKEMDKLLADLAARDMARPEWRKRFAVVRDEYLHHIREEEQEQFEAAEKVLTTADVRYMKQVFERRKKAEKASAKVEKKIRLKD